MAKKSPLKISKDDARRNLLVWIDKGYVNMTYDEVNRIYKKNPAQLIAICHSYMDKWMKQRQKKSSLRSFAHVRNPIVVEEICRQYQCEHPVLAYNFCAEHFQHFIQAQYPSVTREQIQKHLDAIAPRSFTKQAIVVEPVRPVTPQKAVSPQVSNDNNSNNDESQTDSDANATDNSGNDSTTPNNSTKAKKPYQFKQKTDQDQKKQDTTKQEVLKQVTDELSKAVSSNRLRNLTSLGYGASPKLKRKRKKTKQTKQTKQTEQTKPTELTEPIPIEEAPPYGSSAHTNTPYSGGQSYFTPYTSTLDVAEGLLLKQAQAWAQDGMTEKQIQKRLTPFLDKVRRKRRQKKELKTPSPLNKSPDQDENLKKPMLAHNIRAICR